MTYGLQVFDASGNTTFDSNVAVGGVCLGFYTVATGGSTWTFSDFVSETGIVLNVGGTSGYISYTTDNSLGYLRFVFGAGSAGLTFALFAK
jgi:hypothetical protein